MKTAVHLYFVQQGNSGPVKIGVARNIVNRLDQLSSSNAEELHLLAVVPAEHRMEAELHARYGKHRIRGEWFHPAPELMAYIASLPDAILRDLQLRRRRNGARVPLAQAKKIWADPEISSGQARRLLEGWTAPRIREFLGPRNVSHRGRQSAINGAKSKGKPRPAFTAEQLASAKAIWRNVMDYPTWEAAALPLAEIEAANNGDKFTPFRANKLWGPRFERE